MLLTQIEGVGLMLFSLLNCNILTFYNLSNCFSPCTDTPGTVDDRNKYPLSYPCNVWPKDKMPHLEAAAKELGLLLKDVTVKVARHLDALIDSKASTYKSGTLFNALEETEKVKCRLLYYYPKHDDDTNGTSNGSNNNKNKMNNNSWIGWHNDSGFLTALAGEIYVDHTTGSVLDSSPDEHAGLYVADRQDKPRHVAIPADCMAIQLGECTQVLSGGSLVATPHWVKAVEGAPNVARISLAAFVDTPPGFALVTPQGCSREKVCHPELQSRRVPPLEQRWTENGMSFGDFLTKTFQMYYEWTTTTTPEKIDSESKE